MRRGSHRGLVAPLVAFSTLGLASADQIHFDYADVQVALTGPTLTIQDHAGTSLQGSDFDISTDTLIDRANIPDSAAFDLLLSAAVANGGGSDDISLAGTIAGSDIDLGPNAYAADFTNAGLGADLDGVTFFAGVLVIHGSLTGQAGGSILVDPVAGDWTFNGLDDSPSGVGADGVADQISVAQASRGSYRSGATVFFDISVPRFRDGTSTTGISDADTFFAQAALHDGFESTGGDLKLTIGALALRRRR